MEKISQENVMSIIFLQSIEMEELLQSKYDSYYSNIKDKEIKNAVDKYRKNSLEHVKMMKDKMIKLNIQGQ